MSIIANSKAKRFPIPLFCWKEQWSVMAACIIFPGITTAVYMTCFPLYAVLFVSEFDVARTTVMSAFVVCTLMGMILAPYIGYLITKHNVGHLVALGALLIGSGFLVSSVLPSLWLILILFASLMAFGRALTAGVTSNSVVVQLYPRSVGSATGFVMLGVAGISALIPVVVGILLSQFSWRVSFVYIGIFVLAAILPLAFFILNKKISYFSTLAKVSEKVVNPDEHVNINEIANADENITNALEIASWNSKRILSSIQFWTIVAIVVPFLLSVSSVQANLGVYLADAGHSLSIVGVLIGLNAAGSALGAFAMGLLSDKLDIRVVYGFAAGAVSLGLFFLTGQPSLAVIFVAIAMIGIFSSGAVPMVSILIMKHFGKAVYPKVYGLLAPAYIPAMILGPIFPSLMRDIYGTYDYAFISLSILLLPTTCIVIFLLSHKYKT